MCYNLDSDHERRYEIRVTEEKPGSMCWINLPSFYVTEVKLAAKFIVPKFEFVPEKMFKQVKFLPKGEEPLQPLTFYKPCASKMDRGGDKVFNFGNLIIGKNKEK